ncbi:hypothetical protein [Streptomyces bacillaris]|uniref:hypothetical protein n=1 Tax=Streptomyces bacillaris TaxID=68179 RepID=UPI0036FE0859
MTTTYVEVASAEGVWTQALHLPVAATVGQVRRVLTDAARTWPVAAFLPGKGNESVEDVLLYRDPSRTYGTPGVSACDAAVRALVSVTGWTTVDDPSPFDVIVGLGLREGYEVGATRHSPDEVDGHLHAIRRTGWRCYTARLVSARSVGHAVRWYAEDGVVVEAERRLLPAVRAAALGCAQHRYVVTDVTAQRTYALQRATAGARREERAVRHRR